MQDTRPEGAITLTTYAELDQFVAAFADGRMNLVLLIGEGGLQKTRSLRAVLPCGCWCEGQNTAWGLYQTLWENRDEFVILDDVDELYADKGCVRLLKQLCQTERLKTLTWNTKSAAGFPPKQFQTTSRVIVLANDWKTANRNVRALQDRGVTLVFEPTHLEVHARTAEWFWDQEVYDWVGDRLHLIPRHSMRVYILATELKAAGLPWSDLLLRQWVSPKTEAIVQLLADPSFKTEEARAQAFEARGLGSRSTYFDRKKRIAGQPAERRTLAHTAPPLPDGGDPWDILRDLRERGKETYEG
jgi:hypothetical protein